MYTEDFINDNKTFTNITETSKLSELSFKNIYTDSNFSSIYSVLLKFQQWWTSFDSCP